MSIFELWIFVTVIPGIDTMFGLLSIILLLAIVGLSLYSFIEMDDVVAQGCLRIMRKLIPYTIICAVIASILPSERQMLLIAGGYTAINNSEIKKLPTNAAKAVNAWLEAVSEAAGDTGKIAKNK